MNNKFRSYLKKTITIIIIILSIWFLTAIIVWTKREDTVFFTQKGNNCISAIPSTTVEPYWFYINEAFNNSYIDKIEGTIFYIRKSYIYRNEVLFWSVLFCQKE